MPQEFQIPEYHVVYDTETTGPQPFFDQVLQTAAIWTDADFNEIDSIDMRSRLASHIVPTAGALKVTHVDPYEIARAPYGPYEYAHEISEIFGRWSAGGPTSFDGFNTLKYDEEIVRQMLWQNMQEPYITTSRGNTRNDYLHYVRALYARNPEIIEFPDNPKTGKRSFKLEIIAPANGFDDHNAHDALGDVRATIYVAKLVKELDPALFNHMMMMGSANNVKSFVEERKTFKMLGGQMINPGVLDVCLIAEEAANKKSKVAWNLAIDPIPFLDLSPEEILDAMRKVGTPFRPLKCNKTPGVFPIGWEFNHRVSTDDWQPADLETIEFRSDIILDHEDFQKNVAEALRLKVEAYGESETLEERIYSGFPGDADKKRLYSFRRESDWGRRLDIVREFDKAELKQLGLRVIYNNAPEALDRHVLENFREKISEVRHGLSLDYPWHTVGKLMHELDQMLEEDPEDAEALNIRAWALETYPEASNWVPVAERQAQEAALMAEGGADDPDARDEDDVDDLPAAIPKLEQPKLSHKAEQSIPEAPKEQKSAEREPSAQDVPAHQIQKPPVAGISYFDGLD